MPLTQSFGQTLCLRVRGAIRGCYGTCGIRNCLHTPSDPHEVEPNVRKTVDLPAGRLHRRATDDGTTQGGWGRVASASQEDVRDCAQAAWVKVQTGVRLHSPPGERGPYTLTLEPGDPQSVDCGVSVLCEVRPDWSMAAAITCYFDAEIHGSSPVLCGSYRQLHGIAGAVRRTHKMTMRVHPSASRLQSGRT
jgi:hypothetical protein